MLLCFRFRILFFRRVFIGRFLRLRLLGRKLQQIHKLLRGLELNLQALGLLRRQCAAHRRGLQSAELVFWHQQVDGLRHLGHVGDDHRLPAAGVHRDGGQVQLGLRELQSRRKALAGAGNHEVSRAEISGDDLEDDLVVHLRGRLGAKDHRHLPPLTWQEGAENALATALHHCNSARPGVEASPILLLQHVCWHVLDAEVGGQTRESKAALEERLVDNGEAHRHRAAHVAGPKVQDLRQKVHRVGREHANEGGIHRQNLVRPHDAHGDAEGSGAALSVPELWMPVQEVRLGRELDLDSLGSVSLDVRQRRVQLELPLDLLRLLHLNLHRHRGPVPDHHALAEDVAVDAGL
mmetsp:Transcript_114047/g.271514  ORF Transcript_114047/g.271514 Transcript_114047/m.271514 type:complete len:350 (+) Transcript_114047:1449-2498(+)